MSVQYLLTSKHQLLNCLFVLISSNIIYSICMLFKEKPFIFVPVCFRLILYLEGYAYTLVSLQPRCGRPSQSDSLVVAWQLGLQHRHSLNGKIQQGFIWEEARINYHSDAQAEANEPGRTSFPTLLSRSMKRWLTVGSSEHRGHNAGKK